MTSYTTCPIHKADLDLVKKLRDSKKFKNLAETMKVIVEHANAHGAFK